MNKFREYFTESSTMTSLGVTKEQLRKLNNQDAVHIKNDSKFDMIKSKKKVKEYLENQPNGSLIGVSKDNSLYVLTINNDINTRGWSFSFYHIDVNGNLLEKDHYTTVSQAVDSFKKVSNYYVAIDSIVGKGHGTRSMDKIDKTEKIINKFLGLTQKSLVDFTQNIIDREKKKIQVLLDRGNYEEANILISKISKDDTDKVTADIISGLSVVTTNLRDAIMNKVRNIIGKRMDTWYQYSENEKYIRSVFSDISKEAKIKITNHFS